MKKMISSTISVLTSVVLMFAGSTTVFASDTETEVLETGFGEIMLSDLVNYELSFSNQPKIMSNFKDGFYNYGDFLTGNNLNVYNAFMKLDEPTDATITIKLAEPISIKLSALPNSSKFSEEDQEIYQTALFENCKPGIDSALFDRPELYWIEPSGMSVSVGEDTTVTPGFFSGGYTVKIRSLNIIPQWLEGFSSKAEAIQYGVLLDEALEKVPVSGNNRYEILKNIHDYISKFTYYDLSAKFSSSALGALVEPGVVCEGYSEAFKLICDRLDIPCICVFGNLIKEDNAGHMWNYVQMEDGIWYAIDVTWDDLDGAGGLEVKDEYFLKGSKSFFQKHTPVNDYQITQLVYPEISQSDYKLDASSNGRESLDCAYALEELYSMGVENIITFDAHDPRVQNAAPLSGFDNFSAYYQ
ncbi:MAG: hypothetical protein J6Y81_02360, partial [Ruminococcus sp.]|nr:hypothetical protein [Ruminococcus sp.]